MNGAKTWFAAALSKNAYVSSLQNDFLLSQNFVILERFLTIRRIRKDQIASECKSVHIVFSFYAAFRDKFTCFQHHAPLTPLQTVSKDLFLQHRHQLDKGRKRAVWRIWEIRWDSKRLFKTLFRLSERREFFGVKFNALDRVTESIKRLEDMFF